MASPGGHGQVAPGRVCGWVTGTAVALTSLDVGGRNRDYRGPGLQFQAATAYCSAEGPPRPLPHLLQAPGPIGRGTNATGSKTRATCARMALKAIRAVTPRVTERPPGVRGSWGSFSYLQSVSLGSRQDPGTGCSLCLP